MHRGHYCYGYILVIYKSCFPIITQFCFKGRDAKEWRQMIQFPWDTRTQSRNTSDSDSCLQRVREWSINSLHYKYHLISQRAFQGWFLNCLAQAAENQWLADGVALAEGLSVVPSTDAGCFRTDCNSKSTRFNASGLWGHLYSCM